MPPDDLPGLLRLLEDEEAKRRRKGNAIQQVVYGLSFGYLAVAVIVFLIKREADFSTFASFTALFACAAAGVSVSAKHREALSQAARWQNPRLVPHLLEALDADKDEIKSEAKDALKQLLPLLDQVSAPQISLSNHQRRMLEALGRSEDWALASSAIRSLAILGDRSTLKVLDSFGEFTKEARQPVLARKAALAKSAAGDLRLRLAREQIEAETERIESASQRETLQ